MGQFSFLKNISLFKKKGATENSSQPQQKIEKTLDETKTETKNKVKKLFDKLFSSRLGKLSVSTEEIVGLDITRDAVRVVQVNKDKEDNWVLEKFSLRSLDSTKIADNVVDSKDYIAEEIGLAINNAKILTKNVAISIPVTSAIIRVVTSPLMSDQELNSAIETDSLWENLVQLAENLNDYSIFHQVINRDTKSNTMEILFVASKLADVNGYSSVVKKAGLNPVIVDVRCFTLKNALDNTVESSLAKSRSAILEFGIEENYLIIVHNNIPIITDIFLRPQEKKIITEIEEGKASEEAENVVRRYGMQIKQAINEYEGKYETKISEVRCISSLANIHPILAMIKKNLMNINFVLFDPVTNLSVPEYNKDKVNFLNRSTLTSAIGLAYRKMDVFGYYKFVTAVKNINLLPNRDSIRQSSKMKFLSGVAFKGVATAIAALYLLLITVSIVQIQTNKSKLKEFSAVQVEYNKLNKEFVQLSRERSSMMKSLNLGKKIKSNQIQTFITLAQISKSVPARVSFSKLEFDGTKKITLEGTAGSDQDIIAFVANLNKQTFIENASLASMNVPKEEKNTNQKGFVVICTMKS
jgi:type IV pilus assembly protein PilN